MKKFLRSMLALTMTATMVAGCKPSPTPAPATTPSPTPPTTASSEPTATPSPSPSPAASKGDKVLKVAAYDSAYGADMWKEVAKLFEAQHEGVKVELMIEKNLESVLGPAMQSGEFPDVVHLALGRPDALTETMVKENALLELTDVLDMNVPGENVKVKDKIIGGFTDTLVTNPYGNGKTYLAPMFYSPCGLFYDANLFKTNNIEVPKTFDEMWALGDKAKELGVSLFTYPTTGYFDAFFFALLFETGGPELFDKAMRYEQGIWDTPEAKQAFEIVGKLAEYTHPTTTANSNNIDFTKNQQLILDNKAIFMPNGTWITEEMANAPRTEGFEWGFTALPAVKAGGDRYSFTWFEQLWVPAGAENPDLAKEFVAFMYSDKAAEVFAKAGAVQPIKDVSKYLSGENKLFYSIYDSGAKAAVGGWAATDPVEGVNIGDVVFGTVDSIVSGSKTVDQWRTAVSQASDKLRAALKK